MTPIARTLRSARAAVLALSALAVTTPLASAKNAYPPGWNASEQTAPAVYQFVPGGNRYHRVAGAAVTPAATQAANAAIYEFAPGGSRFRQVK